MTREQIIEIVNQKIQTGEIVTDKPPQVILFTDGFTVFLFLSDISPS